MRLLLVKAVCLASAWLLAAGVAAMDLERVACGNDCAVVFAGGKVGVLSGFSFAALWSSALLVFAHRVAAAISDANDAEEPVPKGLAVGAQEVLRYDVVLALFATVPFLLLMVVGGLLKRERMGSVGSVGTDVMWSFIIIPTVVVRVWRVTLPGWRCEIEGIPEEKNVP